MRQFFGFAFSLLFVFAGCVQVPAPSSSTSLEAISDLSLTKRCSNTKYGFSVSYPAAWQANDGSVLPACSVFDSGPIEIPRNSEIPFDLAIVIMAQRMPFEATVTSTQFERVLSSRAMEIAGRDAVRVEVEATGEGLANRGMRSLRYEIDLGGGRTLIASTHDANSAYSNNQDVLSRMVQTLSFP